MQTLQEAKEFLKAGWGKGVQCPCCGQMVKLYPRPFHHSMALCLINLYKLTKTKDRVYFHVNEFGADSTIGGDFAKVKYWGLAVEEEKDPNDTTKRTSGFWAITRKGIEFVLGRETINKRIFIYNKRKVKVDPEQITIQMAIGKHFNYRELMES